MIPSYGAEFFPHWFMYSHYWTVIYESDAGSKSLLDLVLLSPRLFISLSNTDKYCCKVCLCTHMYPSFPLFENLSREFIGFKEKYPVGSPNILHSVIGTYCDCILSV